MSNNQLNIENKFDKKISKYFEKEYPYWNSEVLNIYSKSKRIKDAKKNANLVPHLVGLKKNYQDQLNKLKEAVKILRKKDIDKKLKNKYSNDPFARLNLDITFTNPDPLLLTKSGAYNNNDALKNIALMVYDIMEKACKSYDPHALNDSCSNRNNNNNNNNNIKKKKININNR